MILRLGRVECLVDPHEEEVMQVYPVIKQATSLDIEKDVKGPIKVSLTNPLWFTFRSEREVIAESIVPRKEDVLSPLQAFSLFA